MEQDMDDFMSSFSAALNEEKTEAFEASTLKLVLQALGMSPPQVRKCERAGLTFDWFNEEGFISPKVVAGRVFTYNLEQALTTPTKSPLTAYFQGRLEEQGNNLIVIVKCYRLGRLILTDYTMRHAHTHLHVESRGTYYKLLPFKGFFAREFGKPLEET